METANRAKIGAFGAFSGSLGTLADLVTRVTIALGNPGGRYRRLENSAALSRISPAVLKATGLANGMSTVSVPLSS